MYVKLTVHWYLLLSPCPTVIVAEIFTVTAGSGAEKFVYSFVKTLKCLEWWSLTNIRQAVEALQAWEWGRQSRLVCWCAICTERQGREKERPFFSAFKENGRNVSVPTALCGIIKDGDAKDSLIRFFNYWGFTSPSIVAQLRKLIKH